MEYIASYTTTIDVLVSAKNLEDARLQGLLLLTEGEAGIDLARRYRVFGEEGRTLAVRLATDSDEPGDCIAAAAASPDAIDWNIINESDKAWRAQRVIDVCRQVVAIVEDEDRRGRLVDDSVLESCYLNAKLAFTHLRTRLYDAEVALGKSEAATDAQRRHGIALHVCGKVLSCFDGVDEYGDPDVRPRDITTLYVDALNVIEGLSEYGCGPRGYFDVFISNKRGGGRFCWLGGAILALPNQRLINSVMGNESIEHYAKYDRASFEKHLVKTAKEVSNSKPGRECRKYARCDLSLVGTYNPVDKVMYVSDEMALNAWLTPVDANADADADVDFKPCSIPF